MSPTALAPAKSEFSEQQDAAKLLAVVTQLVRESRPARAAASALDSSLERDLAIDSLARVELLLRIEKEFGVRLADDALSRVETVRDLLQELIKASAVAAPTLAEPIVAAPRSDAVEGAPIDAQTLTAMLLWHVARHPDRAHVLYYRDAEQTETLTYRQLYEAAKISAARLRGPQFGIGPGEAVAIMLPTCLEFFTSFYGVLFAAAVPVPLYPPARPSQLEDHLRRQAGILASCQARILITVPEVRPLARLVQPLAPCLRQIVTTQELAGGASPTVIARSRASDTALLQYTSGSTGNPKGVVLSHANLLANIRAWSERVCIRPEDVCVSWLPLYHDMGLIGTWLGSLYNACQLVLMSPTAFLARPERWLWAIHRHRGTITAAPNFALELLLRRQDEGAFAHLDLVRGACALNGAEPVSPDTVARFIEQFGPHGFGAQTMTPVYGLAECAVGLTVPMPGTAPRIDRIAREPFLSQGRRCPPAPTRRSRSASSRAALRLPGTNAHRRCWGCALPERRVGRIEFRGASATSGYFRNPEETAGLFLNGWLDSGDLGYLADGELYPTGRAKDMIIRGGHNLYPYELEEAIGPCPAYVRVASRYLAVADPRAATEGWSLWPRRARPRRRHACPGAQHQRAAVELLGTPADDSRARPAAERAQDLQRQNPAGRHTRSVRSRPPGRAPRPTWLQVARLAVRGASIGCVAMPVAPGARFTSPMPAPFRALGNRTHGDAHLRATRPSGLGNVPTFRRLALASARVRVIPQGFDRIPRAGPVVFTCNHASYIDGLILLATLPRPVVFVAKQELRSTPLVRFVLDRLATRYVERFAVQESVEDAKRLAAAAKAGESLLFFAEGTFRSETGLLPFHLGAFLTAAQSGVPLVPLALRGTRAVLRGDDWRPHWGKVSVTAGPPLAPGGDGWGAAVALRDAARRFIAANCGEQEHDDLH